MRINATHIPRAAYLLADAALCKQGPAVCLIARRWGFLSGRPAGFAIAWRVMQDQNELHHFLDHDGLFKTMNIITGEVVAIQRSARELLFTAGSYEGLTEVITETGEHVWVEAGLEDRGRKAKTMRYTPTLGGAIASMVVSGVPLTKVCERADMPNYGVVARWRTLYTDFREMLEVARRDRTERWHDEAIGIADKALADGDDKMVGLAKLAVDVRKWAAEKGDPDRYAVKTKVQSEQLTHIYVHTGILRKGDEGYKELAADDVSVQTMAIGGVSNGAGKNEADGTNTGDDNIGHSAASIGELAPSTIVSDPGGSSQHWDDTGGF